jgi:acyl-CoA reductase-like NAD-dependent aldehyde dehydrogenase
LIEVRSPADGRSLGSVLEMTAAEVQAVAKDLRDAQLEWEAIGAEARGKVLLDWADWFLDNSRRLGELVQAESGKAWGDASLETTAAVEILGYYARQGPGYLVPRKIRPHGPVGVLKRMEVRYRPHSLVGVISPWNGPIGAPILDVVPALVAGAAVLSKPSEVVPLSWAAAVAGFREAGGPAVLSCITGAAEAGRAVVDEVDMVMFTGSTRTGRAVAVRCAERLIPCSLELGGKDPMIVLKDADLDRAVDAAAWGGMFNGGQTCVSVERIYVEAPVYADFVQRLGTAVGRLRLGTDAPGSFATEVGALATEGQLEIVERHVADAVSKGARVVVGGHRSGTGRYFEPTVLADVDHTMACMREETFGPTLPVMSVADENEAVRLANDSTYGLSASVWSGDLERAKAVAGRIEAGAVNLNNVIVNLFQFTLPQGGWKESGIGSRFGGAAGVLKFCRTQSIVSDKVAVREPYWFPNSPRRGRLLAGGARLLGARDWRRRLGRTPR